MPVETEASFTGPLATNGVTTEFPFAFQAASAAEIAVMARDAAGHESEVAATAWAVTIAADGAGGTVHFAVPPAPGLSLFIRSTPDFTQRIAFENGSRWLAGPVNEANDRAALKALTLRTDVGRSMLVPLGEEAGQLPRLADRADRLLGFDPAGDPQAFDVSAGALETLGGAAGAIVTTAENIEDVVAVSTNLAGANSIGTVAGAIANVNAVGENVAAIAAVKADLDLGVEASFILRAPEMAQSAAAQAAYVQSFADEINITVAQMMHIQDVLGLATGVYQPQTFDNFAGDGPLNGRLTQRRGQQWLTDWAPPPATAGNINAFSTISGRLGGTGVSQAGRSYGTLQGPVVSVVAARMAVSSFSGTQFHLSYDSSGPGTAKQQGLAVNSVFVGDNGTLSIGGQAGGAASVTFVPKQAVGSPTYAGDTLSFETFIGNDSVTFGRVRLNGQQIIADFQISGQDFPLTGKHGFVGSIAAGSVEDFMIANPQTDAWLLAYGPARVRQINSDRTTLTTTINAFGGHPDIIALYYDLVDETTGLSVPGNSNVRVSNFSALGGGEVSGKTQPATVGTEFFSISMFRHGLIDPDGGQIADSRGSTARFKVGDICVCNGQSNSFRLGENIPSATSIAQPALGDCFFVDAHPTTLEMQRYSRRASADTALAAMHNTLTAATGRATAMIRGGLSGSQIAARGVGSANHDGIRSGIKRSGGSIGWQHFVDGESDALGGTWMNWQAHFDAIHNDLEALSGMPLRTIISAIGSGWGNGFGGNPVQADRNAQSMRRAQWVAAQESPAKYGIYYKSDCQHASGDSLHFNGDGMAEYFRRASIGYLKMLGLSAYDRSGPKLISASRVDPQTIEVVFNLNGGSGLEIVNTGYAGDFGGGVQFSAFPSFDNLIVPAGVALQSAVAGRQAVRWSFVPGAVPSTSYVRTHYGRNPFNPTDDPTINQDMANRASMLRSIYPGEPSIPVAPSFDANGNDYKIAE